MTVSSGRFRRLVGMAEVWWMSFSEVVSVVRSREERPRCAERVFAALWREEGMLYCRGKGRRRDRAGRVAAW